MNIKKAIATTVVTALMVTSVASCASSKKAESEATTEAPEESAVQTEAAAEGEVYLELNGVKIMIGQSYDDIKDDLGATSKPDENVMPCTGEDIPLEIYHFYKGLTIGTTNDGIICEIVANPYGEEPGDAAFNGSIKKGDDISAVTDLLGEADEGDDTYQQYSYGTVTVMFNTENGTTAVDCISITDMTYIYGDAA